MLHITSRADHSGGPRHVYELLSQLKIHVDLFVACPREAPFWDRYLALLGEENVFEIPSRRFSLSTSIRLGLFCRRQKVAIIHSHGRGAGVFGRLLAVFTGAPSVHTFHGYHPPGIIRTLEERWLGKLSDTLVAVSTTEAERLVKHGVAHPGKLRTILNGVTVREATPSTTLSGLRIVGIMRIEPEKEPAQFIEICRLVQQDGELRAEVLGGGSLLNEMRRSVHEAGLAGMVEFVGPVNDTNPFLVGGVIFLATSRVEGMSLAMLEAMSLGIPVVATRVPGHIDIIRNEENGLLFDLGDTTTAAKLIQRLSVDCAMYQRIGHAGKQTILAGHRAERMAGELLAVYRALI